MAGVVCTVNEPHYDSGVIALDAGILAKLGLRLDIPVVRKNYFPYYTVSHKDRENTIHVHT